MLDDVQRRRLPLPESGVEIALIDWGGEGPLALLHHANGFCAAMWHLVAQRLRSHFRVVAMDARGHGDSSKPGGPAAYHWENFGRDVIGVAQALIRERGEERVALGLGHSFGGTALLTASARCPALFERLVLVDPIVHPRPAPGTQAERRERVSGMAQAARDRRHVWESREEARAKWATKEFFAGWDPRALDLYVAEGLRERPDGRFELKCPGEVEATVFETGDSLDVFGLADRVRTPALILWARGGNFTREHFERLAARMGDARVRDADCGHLVPMERPDRVADEALAFVRGS